ncbi:hypothetical protein C8R44DRAFT_849457 [Mycena epipterygia]|nr:hypothetical protein C8R44DRAFT_849457 [Mycena epipterygia]
MYRSNSRPLPSRDVHFGSNVRAASSRDEDTTATLLDSDNISLVMTREAPKNSWYTASDTLRLSSLVLHSVLVVMHLALIGVWARRLEHRFTVVLENQNLMSFQITATMTAFATIYSALLVFVVQKLSMRRSLQMEEVLTATHDNAIAWSGIGAAISHLWRRRARTTHLSIIGVLSAAVYLANILGIHITISSLFSLGSFNSSRTFVAGTYGLPEYNSTPDQIPLQSQNMATYAAGSLYFLPSIINSTTSLGLQEGTLYDVLQTTVPSGNATVNATGCNITCGYVPEAPKLRFSEDDGWWGTKAPKPGIISEATFSSAQSVVLYSTIPIIDSAGKTGPWVKLNPSMNTSVSSIQVFQCSLSLVNQTAVVDAQSQQIHAVEPDFKKTVSTWRPYSGPLDSGDSTANNTTTGNLFIDTWGTWYSSIPSSDFQLDYASGPGSSGLVYASVADLYLIQKLNLPAANHNDTRNVTLHEVENALSILVASMFWTLGHIPPTHRAIYGGIDFSTNNGTLGPDMSLDDVPNPPTLRPGNAAVTEIFVEARLELSIIAVSASLAISVVLMFMSLWLQRGSEDDNSVSINGTGIFHAIWLYRNHPELETLLEQVEHPTDDNLRAAGMVRTRLVGAQLRKQSSGESFRPDGGEMKQRPSDSR